MNWLQLFAGRPNTLRAPQGSPSTAQGGRHTPPERDQIVHAVQPVQPVPQIQTRSISPKEIASQLNNLKNELNKASPRIKLERVCRYLPEGVLFTTVTRERLKLVVPNAGKDLIEFILRDALKLFVITINSIPASDVIEAMGQFKLHGLIDAHLPLDDIDQICAAEPTLGIPPLYGSGIEPLCNSHDRAIDAFHHWPWESSNRDSFYDFQWRLLVPKFSMERLERFETNRILPILKRDAKSVGGGHFSQVYKAKLLADYQDHFTVVTRPLCPCEFILTDQLNST
jgi:hypothetical protein